MKLQIALSLLGDKHKSLLHSTIQRYRSGKQGWLGFWDSNPAGFDLSGRFYLFGTTPSHNIDVADSFALRLNCQQQPGTVPRLVSTVWVRDPERGADAMKMDWDAITLSREVGIRAGITTQTCEARDHLVRLVCSHKQHGYMVCQPVVEVRHTVVGGKLPDELVSGARLGIEQAVERADRHNRTGVKIGNYLLASTKRVVQYKPLYDVALKMAKEAGFDGIASHRPSRADVARLRGRLDAR